MSNEAYQTPKPHGRRIETEPLGQLPDSESSLQMGVLLAGLQPANVNQEQPVSILCPGCGTTVALYKYGLPFEIPYFQTTCNECGIDVDLWSAVAIDASYADTPAPKDLASLVQRAWDHHIWSGVKFDQKVRNDEFTRKYIEKSQQFDWDWTVRCPLCEKTLKALSMRKLDYHHWTRSPDQGVCLCRNCHSAIGGNDYDSEVLNQAYARGFKSHHALQIPRLAVREQLRGRHRSLDKLAETIVGRYYVPRREEAVQSIIASVWQHSDFGSIVPTDLTEGLAATDVTPSDMLQRLQ